MATFNGGFTNLMNGVQSYAGSYEDQASALLDTLMNVGPSIKTDGLNGSQAEQLNTAYNQFSKGLDDYNAYYDNLLNNNASNKKFIANLEAQGVQVDKSFRKEITGYRQQYLDKITAEKTAAQQYFADLKANADSIITGETGFTPQEINSHVTARQEYIHTNVDPYVSDAISMIDNMQANANLAAKEIETVRDEFVQKISNPNATQEEIKSTMKEFNNWSNDYKRGVAGDNSFKLSAANTVLEQQKENVLKQLEVNGYSSKETTDLINDIFGKANSGHAQVLGDGGTLTNAAMSVHEARLEAIQRITGTGPASQVVEPPTPTKKRKAGNAVSTTDVEPMRMKVDEMSIHKIVNTPDGLTSTLVRDGASPVSPSDSLIGEGYFKNHETVGAKKQAQKKAEKIAAGMSEEAVEMSTAKKLLKKHGVNSIVNLGLTIADYKESRREGQGVLKSAAKAGVNFAIGETLGMAAVPFYLASSLPTMAVKAVEGVNKMERQMNSGARMQPFNDVYFQDTQQLATMRQSGMEMAKMSQYNLQQTLMGNEATYMHR